MSDQGAVRAGERTGEVTMHIGAVAERTALSLRTLRHYDEVGLLPPSGRTDGGFRLYTESDVDRLLLIRRMKPLGFTLEEMGELLVLVDHLAEDDAAAADARERLRQYIVRAEEQRADLARKLDMADEFIDLLRARSPE
ncbi:MerR family transcriptional regulator [Nakamurella leprariae]|uniref:MerR family transcriptional regulator n=1 Tax=Nakamurella leprariae TaxID=2803911 RepID=A0A939C275_9ACTN|nr:MerR family transcriptional regulator [Nakamurella leprariae]MBM9467919.1 MerR family transcriptional regulator [Nakamurella leprariae]